MRRIATIGGGESETVSSVSFRSQTSLNEFAEINGAESRVAQAMRGFGACRKWSILPVIEPEMERRPWRAVLPTWPSRLNHVREELRAKWWKVAMSSGCIAKLCS